LESGGHANAVACGHLADTTVKRSLSHDHRQVVLRQERR